FARLVGQPEMLVQLYDPLFLGLSLAVFVLLAVAIGAYPAFYLANIRPRAALDGNAGTSPTLLGRLVSQGLMASQIFVASVLLIFALPMAAQAQYVAALPLGFSMKDVYFVRYYCPDGGRPQGHAAELRCDRRTIEIFRSLPGVKQASIFGGRVLFL